MEWRIWAESTPVVRGQASELMEALQDALEAEPGALGPVAGARLPRLSAVFITDAATLAEAAASGEEIFAKALWNATQGEAEPLRIEVEPEDFEEDSGLLGAHEVAALLGVSRQRVYQYIERPDFPKPAVQLARGQLWEREAVISWKASAPRRPGRPPWTPVTVDGAECSSCGLDRSDDPTLASPQRAPCPGCGDTAVTYRRTLVESVTTTASVSSTFRPGVQERDWHVRWSQLRQRLAALTSARSGPRSAETVHGAEQDVFEFFVSAYHLKDVLIADGVAPKRAVEAAIDASPTLALLADVANMDKHRHLKKRPRSGEVPVIEGPAAEASDGSATWRLLVTIGHKGQRIDALAFARIVIDEWQKTLLALGLPA